MASSGDYCAVLGVPRNAGQGEFQRACRKLARSPFAPLIPLLTNQLLIYQLLIGRRSRACWRP